MSNNKPAAPRRQGRQYKPVAEKDRWIIVPACLVRAFPRQLAAAILTSEFVAKFRRRRNNKMPLAHLTWSPKNKVGTDKSPRSYRAWSYGNQSQLAKRLGWERRQAMRALDAIRAVRPRVFRVDKRAAVAVLFTQGLTELYAKGNRVLQRRIYNEQKKLEKRRPESEAKYVPGLECLPLLDAALFTQGRVTRLQRRDVIRCKGNLGAALLLSALRAKITHFKKRIINRSDGQLSADTGLSEDAIASAREFLRKHKLIHAVREKCDELNWPLYHYAMPPRITKEKEEK